MDKRALSEIFRHRLQRILEQDQRSASSFARETGIDRSALSQFLDPGIVRLPRAEALRRIASTCDVTVDWLLGMDNAPEGRQSLTTSFQLDTAEEDGDTALERWRAEVAGQKIRYVPSRLPDMLNLTSAENEALAERFIRGPSFENMLAGKMPEDMDFEICMPVQVLYDLAMQTGFWRDSDPALCKRQLVHMARVCDENYPTLRLHLFDGRTTYSAPFTVFGKQRVAVYLGDAYLVLTRQEDIRFFVRRFNLLVRETTISPHGISHWIADLARNI